MVLNPLPVTPFLTASPIRNDAFYDVVPKVKLSKAKVLGEVAISKKFQMKIVSVCMLGSCK